MGLPSKHRLKRRLDFQTVYKQGISRSSRYFIVKAVAIAPMTDEDLKTKIGISISRKVSKKAVVRNTIKRHIRNSFRHLLPSVNSPWLIVVIVKPEVKECKYEHFLRELEKLLIRAEIIHGY